MVASKMWAGLGLAAGLLVAQAAGARTTLRAVMHSDLKILDPIWSTAYIVRNHGYMVYDTLFAMDEKGEIKPQMLETFTVSADGTTYDFTLREDLAFHDGAPVTGEDCVASLKRWAVRDALGAKIWGFVGAAEATGAKTFRIVLKEKTGLLITALGKPSSAVPFIMPKRVAMTDPMKQIDDFTGSGPFVFKRDEWKPGDRVVYVKNNAYRPRPEPPSLLSGGKVVNVDRVEWLAITDPQQAVNALVKGEIDLIEAPTHDLFPILRADQDVVLVNYNTLGNQYAFRPNHLQKPLDDPRIRQAFWYALNQKDFLDAVVGNPDYYRICASLFICGTPLSSETGMEGRLGSDFAKSRALLQQAGYDGTPVVLMHPTDLAALANLAPVAKSLLEKGGFKVDMQSMDWQSLLVRAGKKGPPSEGGWHILITSWNAADILNPVMNAFLDSGCEKARAGWPCDPEMEKLRDAFVRETDPGKQRQLAEAVQRRALEWTQYVPLGQWMVPMATRKTVTGVLTSPVPVFWNLRVAR